MSGELAPTQKVKYLRSSSAYLASYVEQPKETISYCAQLLRLHFPGLACGKLDGANPSPFPFHHAILKSGVLGLSEVLIKQVHVPSIDPTSLDV